jgi:hypothetical protein
MHTHKTYTHTAYTVTKHMLSKTYTHKMYTHKIVYCIINVFCKFYFCTIEQNLHVTLAAAPNFDVIIYPNLT